MGSASAPADPLEKAVEEAGVALAAVGGHGRARAALTALLAALDADPWWSVWQKTYHSQREAEDRLEEAEAALSLIEGRACERHGSGGPCADELPTGEVFWCSPCIARRYFARLEVPE